MVPILSKTTFALFVGQPLSPADSPIICHPRVLCQKKRSGIDVNTLRIADLERSTVPRTFSDSVGLRSKWRLGPANQLLPLRVRFSPRTLYFFRPVQSDNLMGRRRCREKQRAPQATTVLPTPLSRANSDRVRVVPFFARCTVLCAPPAALLRLFWDMPMTSHNLT